MICFRKYVFFFLYSFCVAADPKGIILPFYDSCHIERNAQFLSIDHLETNLWDAAEEAFYRVEPFLSEPISCQKQKQAIRNELQKDFCIRLNGIKRIDLPEIEAVFNGFYSNSPQASHIAQEIHKAFETMLLEHVPQEECEDENIPGFECKDLCNPCELIKKCFGYILLSREHKKKS